MSTVSPRLMAMAGVSLGATLVLILLFNRPQPPPAVVRGTEVQHEEGDLPVARDDTGHYAPGSPPAVSESFLRLWWRSHFELAKNLATGEMRARCEHNLQSAVTLDPDQRETLRQMQVIAEAARFDLERAVTTNLPDSDAGVPRKEVRGVVHAHGPTPDGHVADSRREQVLILELVDGGWKVASWTPSRSDAGVLVQ